MATATLLREVRQRRGMPIAELSRRSRVSRNTIYYAESGDALSLETLVKLAAALDVPLADISPDGAQLVAGVA